MLTAIEHFLENRFHVLFCFVIVVVLARVKSTASCSSSPTPRSSLPVVIIIKEVMKQIWNYRQYPWVATIVIKKLSQVLNTRLLATKEEQSRFWNRLRASLERVRRQFNNFELFGGRCVVTEQGKRIWLAFST